MAKSANAAQNTETQSLQKQRNRAQNAGRLEKGKHSQVTKTPVDNSTSNKCGDAPATVENKESQSNLANNAYVAEDGRLESQSISIGSSRTQKGRASRVNPSSEGIDGGPFLLPTSSGSSTSTMFVFGSSSKIRDD